MNATGIGAAVRRKEDYRFITGKGRFSDDFHLDGQAYAVMVRSPHPHARIVRIDAEAAKARVVLARQQLGRTEVRAPFDGVVSERQVSAGDTYDAGGGTDTVNVGDLAMGPEAGNGAKAIGMEAAGEVLACGPGVTRVAPGDAIELVHFVGGG